MLRDSDRMREAMDDLCLQTPPPSAGDLPEPPSRGNIHQRARIFNALSDPTRLQIVELLSDGEERTGKEIADHLGITLALLCHHSNTLQQAGLLIRRKQGQCGYNRLDRELLASCLESLRVATGQGIGP